MYSLHKDILVPDLALTEFGLVANGIIEFAADHVLQDQSDTVFILIDIVDVDDAGVIQSNEHIYFVFGLEPLIIIDFDGEFLPVLAFDGLPHRAR